MMTDIQLNPSAPETADRIPVSTVEGAALASGPYLLSDGRTLAEPIPVEVVEGATVLRNGVLLPVLTPADLGAFE